MKTFLKLNIIIICLILITGCISKEYYCDSGDILKGTSCISQNETPAQIEYYCSDLQYHLSGNKCYRNFGSAGTLSIRADERYYCTSGYLKGHKCIIETTYNAYIR